MVSLLGIMAAIAAVLAIVVTSLFIGVCVAVARITDVGREDRVRGPGGARPAVVPAAGSRRRDGSGVPAASWRADR